MSKAPAYHQAFMREAYAMWPTYVCPCGRGCKPTVEDLARDLWAQSIVGSRPGSDRALFAVPPSPVRIPEPEPMSGGRCRGCGRAMQLPEFLARFLELRRAAWPECDDCTALVVH